MTRTYKAGGTLDPEENYYIHRKADDELLRWCLQGEYAYACPMDQRFLDAAGIGANELKGFVATGAPDEEIGRWIEEHSRQPATR